MRAGFNHSKVRECVVYIVFSYTMSAKSSTGGIYVLLLTDLNHLQACNTKNVNSNANYLLLMINDNNNTNCNDN